MSILNVPVPFSFVAVNGVQVGEAATGSDEGVSLGVIGSLLVVAVVAVVACNACNSRIAHNARNAEGSGCVQRRNDVDNSQWSGGPASSVMGPKCSSVIGSSLQAMLQRRCGPWSLVIDEGHWGRSFRRNGFEVQGDDSAQLRLGLEPMTWSNWPWQQGEGATVVGMT